MDSSPHLLPDSLKCRSSPVAGADCCPDTKVREREGVKGSWSPDHLQCRARGRAHSWMGTQLSSSVAAYPAQLRKKIKEFNQTRPILREPSALGDRSKVHQCHPISVKATRVPSGGRGSGGSTYLIVMQRQAEFAFIGSQMVFHKIWVLGGNTSTC